MVHSLTISLKQIIEIIKKQYIVYLDYVFYFKSRDTLNSDRTNLHRKSTNVPGVIISVLTFRECCYIIRHHATSTGVQSKRLTWYSIFNEYIFYILQSIFWELKSCKCAVPNKTIPLRSVVPGRSHPFPLAGVGTIPSFSDLRCRGETIPLPLWCRG